ncbi:MAG: peptide ABC transporter substrate-binding protein [Planctomycetota bacterium]|nr:MAG: peptide ABC transporter substrate-binding protein [Planctomycetota bacterium]
MSALVRCTSARPPMPDRVCKLALLAVPLAVLAVFAWAVSGERRPAADFTFVNETEIFSVDPAIAHGQPEGRIVNVLFEGLYRYHHETMAPKPGVAEALPEISADGRVYTIRLRPDARWSDDRDEYGKAKDSSPVTAYDFAWSWQRLLFPATGSRNAQHLWHIKNARRYTQGEVEIGDRVEVELPKTESADQPFPRGEILRGKLIAIDRPPEPPAPPDELPDAREQRLAEWRATWIYDVDINGEVKGFGKAAAMSHAPHPAPRALTLCSHVLLDFREVGIEALDARTLRVTLAQPTPYFTEILCFYPTFPVHPPTVERHGAPRWTRLENVVGNGPYRMVFRRIRDRLRLTKSPTYWNAARVDLDTIDALAVTSRTTALNMYLNGQVDWIASVPDTVIDRVAQRPDYNSSTYLSVYFFRLNVRRKPLDDVRVRRALDLALDKRQLVAAIARGGEKPATAYVPPGMAGYTSPAAEEYNPELARKLLAEAGYPGGRGMRIIELLYNKDERHERIAEVLQSDWKRNLGIDVKLRNEEWGIYLNTIHKGEYDIARGGWIGDYVDPNTFLELFITGGENNETGWSNAEYDRLIAEAATTADGAERANILKRAEAIVLAERPIIPLYFYVSKNMVRPYVKGFHSTPLDVHPLEMLRVDQAEKDRYLRVEGLR